MKDERSVSWVFVAYPESLPDNWIDLLTETMVSFCISPLHDKDLDATGELKKAHWHVILSYGSKKSFNQVKEITDMLNQPIPQPCRNVKGYVRYLVHKDNPDKAQYDESLIQCFNGFDIGTYLKVSCTDRYLALSEMVQLIDDSDITEYSDFLLWCRTNNFEWFKILCDSGTFMIKEYITSRRHKKREKI